MESFMDGFYKQASARRYEGPLELWLAEAKDKEEQLKRDKKEVRADPRELSESYAADTWHRQGA